MMFEARRSSTRGRRTAALALTPLLLALALLAGPKPAAAQQQWPDVNVYHSPDDDGVDPRSETCPPGCLCNGGGPGGTVTINFDELDPPDIVHVITESQYHDQGVTFTPDGTVIWAHPEAGNDGSSAPFWIRPMMDCDPDYCSETIAVDFASPVENLSFVAVPTSNDYGMLWVDVYEDGVAQPPEQFYIDFYSAGTTVDLSDYSNVTRIFIYGVDNHPAYDNFTFDTGGGEYDCLINGGANEEAHVWIDGGSTGGDGDICKLPPDGDTGDYLCGADILIEITQGTGKLTDFRPVIDTLVHHPVCQGSPDGNGFCPLPPDTTRIRMNFRRGEGSPPIGPRKVADMRIDSTGSTVGAPTTVVVSGKEAASANLQPRPIAGSGPETIAEGPVGPDEPCVLECDFDGNGGVGLTDFNFLVSNWGTTGPTCTRPGPNAGLPGDCDCNGSVGLTDYSQFNIEWGQACPQ